jgi:CheY-like chemotaxis protein
VVEKETNINYLLENIYKQLLLDKVSPEVTFSYHAPLPDELANIFTDPIKLMQVMVNLVGNALKFTHQGYVRFGYDLVEDTLHFFVEDSGIGIHEEMHELIFQRFRQVDNSATRKYGGTGLGLALSKGYVELMGGRIEIKSKPGMGSTFSFKLPNKMILHDSTEKTEPKAQNYAILHGKTILVAEDEIYNFAMIEEFLTSVNIKVIKAENGLEAVNICLGHNAPDLVLMDIKMPMMDGMEASKRIKENKPGLPIIALTAYAFESDKDKILEAGCDAYLVKPIQQRVLYGTLAKFLSI